jgi:DNA invertase Pin-like site-specific DNA recombinase
MAQKERDSIRIRQAEGIAAAKKEGKRFGRPRQGITENFIKAYEQWKVQGEISAVRAMEWAGMTKDTFYRRVKEYEAQINVYTQEGGDNA